MNKDYLKPIEFNINLINNSIKKANNGFTIFN